MTTKPNAADIDRLLDYGRAPYLGHLKAAQTLDRAGNTLQDALGGARVALLSSFTLDPLVPCLRARAASRGLTLDTYLAPYGQYRRQILTADSELAAFAAELTLLWVDPAELFPQLYRDPYRASANERRRQVEEGVAEFATLVEQLRQRVDGVIVICNFPAPLYSEMGILEGNQTGGVMQSIAQANELLQQAVNQLPSSYVFDLQQSIRRFGLVQAIDRKMANYAALPVSMECMTYIANELLGFLLPLKGIVRKCLVVDLDNTLWGGIVGEVGWAEVSIGRDTPAGRAFADFQQTLLRFYNRGLVLAINSKNNLQDAMEVFEKREEMLLKPEHFATMQINWRDKASNMRAIAEELNIGLGSLVFFDDNPRERALIRELLPQVLVPELPPQADGYADTLASMVDLNMLELTEEDRRKGALYSQQSARRSLQQQANSLEGYLASLETVVKVRPATPASVTRLAQLSQKTNQFNLTTRRYPAEAIRQLLHAEDTVIHSLQVCDRIGDLGIVGLSIARQVAAEDWELDTFLLSCRCIGRHVEEAFLDAIVSALRKRNARSLELQHIPSARNQVSREFLERLGMPSNQRTLRYPLPDAPVLTPKWIRHA